MSETVPQDQPVLPTLPRALADPRPVIVAGTLAWLVATVVVLVLVLTGRDGLGSTVATCVVGVALGGIGFGIFSWQRRTVRSGSGRGQGGLG